MYSESSREKPRPVEVKAESRDGLIFWIIEYSDGSERIEQSDGLTTENTSGRGMQAELAKKRRELGVEDQDYAQAA